MSGISGRCLPGRPRTDTDTTLRGVRIYIPLCSNTRRPRSHRSERTMRSSKSISARSDQMTQALDEASAKATTMLFEHYFSGTTHGTTIAVAVLQIGQLHGYLVPALFRSNGEATFG